MRRRRPTRAHAAIGGLLALLLSAAPALAAEAERSVMESGSLYNALWAIGIFLVLVVILGRYAWKPILRNMQQREKFIADALERARLQQEQSERLLAEYGAKLESADAEAAKRLEQALAAAEQAKREILGTARSEADLLAKRAAAEVDVAKQAAQQELMALAAKLATAVAEKIIRRQLAPEDQRRLVDESLAELRRHGRWR